MLDEPSLGLAPRKMVDELLATFGALPTAAPR
jgi:ABC-type branched-subunit amino acid transport system ATPase component